MLRKYTIWFGLILLPILLFAQTQSVEDAFGARPLGMGRTFVAIADDGNAPYWNPAGMDYGKERIVTGMFSRLFLGVDGDNIGEGFLSYLHHFDNAGSISLSMTHFYSNIWKESTVNLGYAKTLGHKFSVGVNGRLLMNGVTQGNIGYDPRAGDASHDIGDPALDPMFVGGWNQMGFTGGFGLMYKPSRNLSLGLNAANLNQPDMSWQGVGEAGQIPMTIRTGAAYTFRNVFTVAGDFRYNMQEINGGNQFKPYGGVEYWFMDKAIALRTGANPEEYTFGFSYRSKKFLDMQLDYAFMYPLTEIRKTGSTSHRVSLSLRFLPPPKPLYDLAIPTGSMNVYPKNAIIGEEVAITTVVKNLGEKEVGDFSVSLYYNDTEMGWVNAAAPILVEDKLAVGEEIELEFLWTPEEKGHYQFYAVADDDGSIKPEIYGEIDEFDEDNNKGSIECDVFPLPTGTVSPLENQLEVSELTLIREEEPVVPIFFFDPHSDRIQDRFQHLINILAYRLKDNPDIKINVRGHFSPESEAPNMPDYGERLAINRAKAVKSVFARYWPDVGNQFETVDVTSYDPSLRRSGLTEEHLEKDKSLAESENRRAELDTYVKGFEDFNPVLYFDKNETDIDKSALASMKRRADEIKNLMERNPELILFIQGFTTENESRPVNLAFDRAQAVRNELGNILGQDFAERFRKRIFIKANTDYHVDHGRAEISLSGESLIYRPLEGKLAASGYEMNQDQVNFVNITSNVEAGVASYKISIVDSDGDEFVELAKGDGNIPDGVPWDWKDANGNLINPTDAYFCKLEIEDKLGQSFTTVSDTIDVQVSQRQQMLETLVLVQFGFDVKISESPFLESRVEYVAQKFIDKAREPKTKMEAIVGGHTDVIGMDHRNRELSIFRAQKEEENLRRYLIYLLGLENNSELNRWLRAHNTTLTYKGYADNKPYIINKWDDDELITEKIGENDLPEGRTINRRVVIEFMTDKEGEDLRIEDKVEAQSAN
ncbi:MAG: CARDB domain-containing protein [Candidatus Zixiibacteriota bacterium]